MKTYEIAKINSQIISDEPAFIEKSENYFYKEIDKTANSILAKNPDECPLILISGPSGSGKTTTAIKLFNSIKSKGVNVCYLSMDSYFKTFTDDERELKEKSKIDLESPNRVDKTTINNDILALIQGKTVNAKTYDFLNNIQNETNTKLSRRGGFVIVEGIHALNPAVLDFDLCSTSVYVSVRTRVVSDDGEKLHPCKIRLMRRMIRDKLYRHRDIQETVKMFNNVQRGENKFILPYKPRADIDIDTFIRYEPALYKNYLYNDIVALADKYADLRDIEKALGSVEKIEKDSLPKDALMREFIGGSVLRY